MSPIKENLKVMLYWGWSLEQDQARLQANRESMRRRMSKDGVSIVVMQGHQTVVPSENGWMLNECMKHWNMKGVSFLCLKVKGGLMSYEIHKFVEMPLKFFIKHRDLLVINT